MPMAHADADADADAFVGASYVRNVAERASERAAKPGKIRAAGGRTHKTFKERKGDSWLVCANDTRDPRKNNNTCMYNFVHTFGEVLVFPDDHHPLRQILERSGRQG